MGSDEVELPDYSDASVLYYDKRPGRWTLFDTGATFESFKIVSVTETSIEEFADLEIHDEDLQEKVDEKGGGKIMGLGGESISILQKEALPILRKILLEEILSI